MLTELLLEQPDDPHAFLTEKLAKMSKAEREAMKSRVASYNTSKKNEFKQDMVHVVCTYFLKSGVKDKCLAIVKELKEFSVALNECKRFDVLDEPSKDSLCIISVWESSYSYENYSNSDTFRQCSTRLRPFLVKDSEVKQYSYSSIEL